MRILVVQTSPLGNVIHALPVISDLRREFPAVAIDWCVEENLAGIARLHPAVDRILPVASRRWRQKLFSMVTWQEIQAFRRTLQAVDYDAVLDLQGLIKSAIIARQACGPVCGYDAAVAREKLAARFYDATFLIPRIGHAVQRARWLAAAALELPLETPLDFGIGAKPLVAEWLPPQPYVVFLTTCNGGNNLWPESHWFTLGQALRTKGYFTVLPVITEAEKAGTSRIAGSIPDAVVTPALTIETLASLQSGAAGIIGVNNDYTQLAAALGRPVIALHTSSDPETSGVLATSPFRNLGGQGKIPEVAAVLNAFLTCTG